MDVAVDGCVLDRCAGHLCSLLEMVGAEEKGESVEKLRDFSAGTQAWQMTEGTSPSAQPSSDLAVFRLRCTMSFMNGPDCGPVNPLQSLLKHAERDASIQHDRFQPAAGPSSTAASNGMRTAASPAGAMSQAELDREMQQFGFGLPGQRDAGAAFAMEAMKRELAQSAAGPASGSQTPMNAGE